MDTWGKMTTAIMFSTDYDSSEVYEPCNSVQVELRSVGLVCIYILAIIFSLLGNSLVIYVICCMECRKSSTDVYLMNVAVADLLFCLTLPFWAVYMQSEWVFGTFMCKVLSGLQEVTVYSSVLLLACISVDRYLAIVKATQMITKQRHMVTIVCIWVWCVSFLFALPIFIQLEAFQTVDPNRWVCHQNLTAVILDQWRVGIRLLRYMAGFFLPLLVMLFCYGVTTFKLYRTRNIQKHRAMRLILLVVLGFVVCWMPYHLTVLMDTMMRGQLLKETCKLRENLDLALQATQVLAFLHCTINPVLYAFVGQKFRNQLLTILFKHGLISKRVLQTYRKGSGYISSSGNTSITR